MLQVEGNSASAKREVYGSLMWVINPLLNEGKTLLSTDATIKVRVNKEYKNFNATGANNGKPMYSWNMEAVHTETSSRDALADALKLINVEPNTKWEYSNTGYALLASIIEKVSGISYGDYLNKAIFKPLKMTNTFVYRRRYEPKKIANYAYGYVYSDSLKKYFLPDDLTESKMVIS